MGPTLADTGFFNKSYLKEMLEQHQSGRRDYSASLWSLLMFESFLRNVLDTEQPGARKTELKVA
jgi:asparagine synthase (glutamine-hydrolysing)